MEGLPMKGSILGGLAVVAMLGGPALAADIPVKAPPMAVTFNWSGFYVGGTGGYNNGHLHWFYPNAGTYPAENPFEISGWNGGIFGGLQWQINRFVFGVEANGLWGDITGFSVCPNTIYRCQASVDDVWSVGGRVGYVWGGASQYLSYITGGFASAQVKSPAFVIATGALFETGSARHDGWYIGSGFDFRLIGNWIAGFEFRHYQLDSRIHVVTPALSSDDRLIKPDWNSWLFRLSYKFDWAAPLMARY
jgi:outer membrane immunogenic protein